MAEQVETLLQVEMEATAVLALAAVLLIEPLRALREMEECLVAEALLLPTPAQPLLAMAD
jgi:hypothetical protein